MAKKKYTKKEKAARRNQYYLRTYGIDTAYYNKLLKAQKSKCGICGKTEKNNKQHFDIDHNHRTGQVRGLLCCYCNRRLLRYFRDNKTIAKGLVKYLTAALKNDKYWKE